MRPLTIRSFKLFICLTAAVLVLATGMARGDDFALDTDQVKAALHTATDEEGGFIDRTIGMVQSGTLPRELFTSSFIWARKKPKHKFQYFKQALSIRAAAVGISL